MPWPAEEKVARSLRARGAKCFVNTKLPGATDIIAEWPTGTKWRVQVKFSNNGRPKWPSKKEKQRLKISATKNNQTPVVAFVYSNGKIEFYSARTGRRIIPPCIKRRGR